MDLRGKRLLIFIVAYNAETTIEKVLDRIPASLHSENVEVLIIDDFSKDNTFSNGLRFQQQKFRVQDYRPADAREPGIRRKPKTGISLRHRQRVRHRGADPWRRAIRAGEIARTTCGRSFAAKPTPFSVRG